MSSWLERQIAKFDSETLKPRNTLFKSNPVKDILVAFLLALIIIAGEFTFRRIVAMLLPTYFDYFFMDLLCLGGFYVVICLLVYPLIGGNVAEKLGYTGFNLRDRYQLTTFYYAALAVVISIQVINRIDVYLFTGVDWNPQVIPILEAFFHTSFYTNLSLYAENAKLAISVIFILVNGIWLARVQAKLLPLTMDSHYHSKHTIQRQTHGGRHGAHQAPLPHQLRVDSWLGKTAHKHRDINNYPHLHQPTRHYLLDNPKLSISLESARLDNKIKRGDAYCV